MDAMERASILQDIDEAVKQITYSNIKGKPYAEVKERVKAFRRVFPDGCIMTKVKHDDGDHCTVKAEIFVRDPATGQTIILATGHASETRTASNVNKTSYLENCETSAVGRALGFAGFGIDAAIASADEVDHDLEAQDALKKAELEEQTLSPVEAAAFEAHLTAEGVNVEKVIAHFKLNSLEDMKLKTYRNILDHMKQAKEAWA